MEVAAAAGCYGNMGHRYWQLDREHQMEWGDVGRGKEGGSRAGGGERVLQLKARILKRRHRHRRRDTVEAEM